MTINVAVTGIGNCCSSLVQGIYYYVNAKEEEKVPGLLHINFGGYKLTDINFVSAFDVDERKVGKDLSEAIFSEPNCTTIFQKNVPKQDVTVKKGPVLDSLKGNLERVIPVSKEKPVNIAKHLKETDADMLVSYLPVGSHEATRFYAEECLKAGVAFVNCIPEFIVSDVKWAKRFEKARIPCAGDDVQSQLGATVLHKTITKLLVDRGIKVENTYQLNIGGNTDFLNMASGEFRLTSKRESKTSAVRAMVPYDVPMKIGPSEYIPHLKDNKVMYVNILGKKFGDIPLNIDVKLSVEDSPNSAGVAIDAIRAVKLAMDRNIGGALTSISSYCFKHPPIQMPYHEAKQAVEEFINGERER